MALAGLPHEFVQDGLHLTNHSVSEMSAQDTCAPRRMSRARAATAKEAVRLDPFKTVEVELPVIGEETVLLDPVEDCAVGEAVADLPHLDHSSWAAHTASTSAEARTGSNEVVLTAEGVEIVAVGVLSVLVVRVPVRAHDVVVDVVIAVEAAAPVASIAPR